MTDYTKIQVQIGQRNYGGAPFFLERWEILKPNGKDVQKKERHTEGPQKKELR